MATICYRCKHFRNGEPDSPREDVWYNHICIVSPEVMIMNYVTGKKESSGGHEYRDGKYYKYCRDVNGDGNCPKFESANPC